MKFSAAFIVGTALCLSASTSMAAVSLLAVSGPITLNGGSQGIYSSIAMGVNYFTAGGMMPGGFIMFPSPYNALFIGATAVNGDGGKAFVANSTTDPNFSAFVALLTDGTNQNMGGGASLGNVYSALPGDSSEASFFALPAGNNGIDFQGFSIDHIDFFVSSISINSPGSNPNGDGNWTDYSLAGAFQVYGASTAVPEPSALGLLALVTIGLVNRRKRSSKSNLG